MYSIFNFVYCKSFAVVKRCLLNKSITYLLIQGTSFDQDNRFMNKNKKFMKSMKFSESLEKKVCSLTFFLKHSFKN